MDAQRFGQPPRGACAFSGSPPNFLSGRCAAPQLMPTCRVDAANEKVTTLMFRNLPRRYTANALAKELEAYVHSSAYDFLYVPFTKCVSDNIGFAFVNFVDADTAATIQHVLDGKPWRLVKATRPITILAAHIQGLRCNLAHCVATIAPYADAIRLPWIFENGEQIPFSVAVQRHLGRQRGMPSARSAAHQIESFAKEVQQACVEHLPNQATLLAQSPWPSAAETNPHHHIADDAASMLQAFPAQLGEAQFSKSAALLSPTQVSMMAGAAGAGADTQVSLMACAAGAGADESTYSSGDIAFGHAARQQPSRQISDAQLCQSPCRSGASSHEATSYAQASAQAASGILGKAAQAPNHDGSQHQRNNPVCNPSSVRASLGYLRASHNMTVMLQELLECYEHGQGWHPSPAQPQPRVQAYVG
mmetsp:Transcript_98007/g.253436  ORF Transcript_98007/g.253436 Transcript_98007/m.253436 type:complete len:419 (-) Transcript_98007:26-1282(-)